MRKPIIVGNWKMNKTMKETKEFIEAVDPAAASENATFGIGAPFTALSTAVAAANNLIIAAENCHFEDSGAFTGEVSVPMLQEVGVTHCIIGHSERRTMFGDTDETVNKKAKRLIEAGITPILCIGETEAQYDAGESEKVIRDQLTGSLADMCAKCVADIVIAYEPIWATGTGKSASVEIAENCCRIVRDQVKVMYGEEAAEKDSRTVRRFRQAEQHRRIYGTAGYRRRTDRRRKLEGRQLHRDHREDKISQYSAYMKT